MTSASVAVTLSARRRASAAQTIGFGVVAVVFVYTTIVNIIERPDGVKIASLFILAIIVVSLVSRISRSFELRTSRIVLDDKAAGVLHRLRRSGRPAHRARPGLRRRAHPRLQGEAATGREPHPVRGSGHLPRGHPGRRVGLQQRTDVHGAIRNGRRVLEMSSPAVSNSIAALLLHLRDEYRVKPNVYFEWTEGNPVTNLLRFLFLGVGEIAPTTREVLRRAEPDRSRRPKVHVG